MSDEDLITNLRLLMDHNVLSGPETDRALDFIERIDEPDPATDSCCDELPSELRRDEAESILQRNMTYLIDLQKHIQ